MSWLLYSDWTELNDISCLYLEFRNDVRQKANSSYFPEFKMGCKAVDTTRNINSISGPGTANERTVQWWFKKFCKGDENLEDEECSGSHHKLTKTNWEPSSKLILLQLHEKLSRNSMLTILWSLSIWSKLERWKSWISGCRMSWLKVTVLKCHIFLFYAITTKHFLVGLGCVTKSRFYTTTSDD